MATRIVVLDSGASSVRLGFGGNESPGIVGPNVMGVPRYRRVVSASQEVFYGTEATDQMGLLSFRSPSVPGQPMNWEEQSAIWSYYFSKLGIDPKDHTLLFTVPSNAPITYMEKVLDTLLEKHLFRGVIPMESAPLALFAAGMDSGLVLESGESHTVAVPVSRGYIIQPAIRTSKVNGRTVTDSLYKMLLRSKVDLSTSAERLLLEDIKRNRCIVRPKDETKEVVAEPYVLPDGTELTVEANKKMAAIKWHTGPPELLFSPQLAGIDTLPLHNLVEASISATDVSLQRGLWNSVLLAGGNTYINGLPGRLVKELRDIAPPSFDVSVHAPENRGISSWLGGSIAAELNNDSLVVTRENKADKLREYARIE